MRCRPKGNAKHAVGARAGKAIQKRRARARGEPHTRPHKLDKKPTSRQRHRPHEHRCLRSSPSKPDPPPQHHEHHWVPKPPGPPPQHMSIIGSPLLLLKAIVTLCKGHENHARTLSLPRRDLEPLSRNGDAADAHDARRAPPKAPLSRSTNSSKSSVWAAFPALECF